VGGDADATAGATPDTDGRRLAEALAHARDRAITFFSLLDRHGAAAAVQADLPALAKKAGGKAKIKAPSADEIKPEIDATQKLGAAHLAACEPDYSAWLAAIGAPHR